MATALTLRAVKGAELTFAEVDGNFTALRDTADAAAAATGGMNFAQSRWVFCDFHYNAVGVFDPLQGAPISSGTVNAVASAQNSTLHPGAVLLRSATTANSGYIFTTNGSGSFIGAAGLMFRGCLAPIGAHTDRIMRFGFHDAATYLDAVDGAYFEMLSGVVTAKTSSNSTRTTGASSFTMSVDTWYWFDIEFLSASSVKFTMFDDAGSVVLTETISTNVPSLTTRGFSAKLTATYTPATAADLCAVDYMGFGPARPPYIVTPA